jgi:hypothetical protein
MVEEAEAHSRTEVSTHEKNLSAKTRSRKESQPLPPALLGSPNAAQQSDCDYYEQDEKQHIPDFVETPLPFHKEWVAFKRETVEKVRHGA